MAQVMAKVRCYGMYGLIGGPFPYGLYYSGGMDTLAKKIRALGANFEVPPTFGFGQWRTIADDIRRQPDETSVVIYGHSMGANLVTAAASRAKRRVDLVAAFDPTVWYPITDIGANVQRAISFHGTSFLSLVGHGELKAGEGFKGKLEKYKVDDRHEVIDDDEKLHEIVLDAVRALA
jgi:pimeloyl-ACP methyl ester carboxylesterase